MRRTAQSRSSRNPLALPVIAIVVITGMLCGATSASGQAGYNKATKKLEAAFKVAGNARIASDDGCYPAPADLAEMIGGRAAETRKSIKKRGIVHVIEAGSNCNRVQLAVRTKAGTWVLDSNTGNVVLKPTPNSIRRLQARASLRS